jgi:hypothetical protein
MQWFDAASMHVTVQTILDVVVQRVILSAPWNRHVACVIDA